MFWTVQWLKPDSLTFSIQCFFGLLLHEISAFVSMPILAARLQMFPNLKLVILVPRWVTPYDYSVSIGLLNPWHPHKSTGVYVTPNSTTCNVTRVRKLDFLKDSPELRRPESNAVQNLIWDSGKTPLEHIQSTAATRKNSRSYRTKSLYSYFFKNTVRFT